MDTPEPSAKRRRVNVLQKPFVSPFKMPLKSDASTADTGSAAVPTPTSKPKDTSTSLPTLSTRTPQQRPRAAPPPISISELNSDPAIAQLLKTQRALERELRELKQELDLTLQARKIERDSRAYDAKPEPLLIDGELRDLIVKWKGAGQAAAEELFGAARDKINHMGGPRAWKDRVKEQEERQREFERGDLETAKGAADDEDELDSEEDPEGESRFVQREKRDLYAEYGDVEVETENERLARGGELESEKALDGEEDEFTMPMMLRQLGVDFKIIGYNREDQRWEE